MPERRIRKSPERQTVWAVFCGEANDEGVMEDSLVRVVYDTKEAATDHVRYADEALDHVGELAGLVYWVESWDVRSGGFDPEDQEAL
jgi:hypothetical protein